MSEKAAEKMPTANHRRLVLLACFFSILFWSMNYSAYSPLLFMIKKDLALSYTQSGMLATSFFIGYAAGQIPWGHLADRLGGRLSITISLIGIACASGMFAFSQNVSEAYLWRLASGLLGAGIFVPAIKTLTDSFTKAERAVAVGLFSAGGSLGFILVPPASLALAAQFGWRASILFFALITLVASAFGWFLLKYTPPGGGGKTRILIPWKTFRRLDFWMLGYSHFIRLGVVLTLISWMPLFLLEAHNFSVLASGLSISVMNVVSIPAAPLGGWMSRKTDDSLVVILTFSVLAPCVYFFGIVDNQSLLWLLVSVNGFFSVLHFGPMWSLSSKKSPPGQVGLLSGYYNTLASAGALTMPLLLGYVKDYVGSFSLGWLLIALLTAVGVLATLIVRMKT